MYPAMKEHLPNGEAAVNHDLDEHRQLEQTLKELEGVDGSDPRFGELIPTLETALADHVTDEETNQFPKFRSASRPAARGTRREGGGGEKGGADASPPIHAEQPAVPQAGRPGRGHG